MNILPGLNATVIDTGLWHILRNAKTRTFADVRKRHLVLRLITEMRLDNHPSGYPDPVNISMLTHYIRDEKFRIVREQGRGSSAAAEIQQLIDWLKRLEKAALEARPVSVSRLPWYRAWSDLAGIILMLASPAFLALVVYRPPDCISVLTLIVYALLTTVAESISQDNFAPQFATITRSVLVIAAVGMALHYAHITVGRF
jgi:hypothetical protein